MPNDDVESLDDIPTYEASDACPPKRLCLRFAECLCDELPATEVKGIDMISNCCKEAVVTSSEMSIQEMMPFAYCGRDLIYKWLGHTGGCLIGGFENWSRRMGFV